MRDTYAGPVVQLAECVCEFGSLIHCRIYKNRSFNLNTDKTRQWCSLISSGVVKDDSGRVF